MASLKLLDSKETSGHLQVCLNKVFRLQERAEQRPLLREPLADEEKPTNLP